MTPPWNDVPAGKYLSKLCQQSIRASISLSASQLHTRFWQGHGDEHGQRLTHHTSALSYVVVPHPTVRSYAPKLSNVLDTRVRRNQGLYSRSGRHEKPIFRFSCFTDILQTRIVILRHPIQTIFSYSPMDWPHKTRVSHGHTHKLYIAPSRPPFSFLEILALQFTRTHHILHRVRLASLEIFGSGSSSFPRCRFLLVGSFFDPSGFFG